MAGWTRKVRDVALLLAFVGAELTAWFGLSRGATQHLDWTIQYGNVARLCYATPKALVGVYADGQFQFPGPTVTVTEGDTVEVSVTNQVDYNVTIHWHGVRQLRSAWADGPAYITQCPIRKGQSYVYRFRVVDQRGTLFWHAHLSWLRATLYGAFIIQKKPTLLLPFTAPDKELPPIIFGEWWNANVEDVIAAGLANGGFYNLSDALTINGQPGALYNCSIDLQNTPVFSVARGKTYLLRLINAAMNFQMYFAVANHTLTVVEVDAEFTRRLDTDVVVLAPGQSTNVLLKANQPNGQYFMAITPFSPATRIPFPPTPATAVLRYSSSPSSTVSATLPMPSFPAVADTAYVANFTQSLKGRAYSEGYYYYAIPTKVDVDLLYTVGYAIQQCASCPRGFRLETSVNNVVFQLPSVSLLQAYYYNTSGVYTTDFPDVPDPQYDYTGVNQAGQLAPVLGTKVRVLELGVNVQIVFQNTATVFFESHPIHLHGQNFYVVGTGFGNYNASSDPGTFNLKNPPSRNTIAVPSGGWAAVRFHTTNPGVWYMHCHLELHTSIGMSMAFIVKNGDSNNALPPPPSDLPAC